MDTVRLFRLRAMVNEAAQVEATHFLPGFVAADLKKSVIVARGRVAARLHVR
jgi:hypothetical protein